MVVLLALGGLWRRWGCLRAIVPFRKATEQLSMFEELLKHFYMSRIGMKSHDFSIAGLFLSLFEGFPADGQGMARGRAREPRGGGGAPGLSLTAVSANLSQNPWTQPRNVAASYSSFF